jgi:putative flippase GtrA
VISMITRLRDVRFVRYILASVGALAVDVGSFLALLSLGVMAAGASALSYSLGILAHWLLSSRTVFHDTVAQKGIERTKQKALFVISALLGLALTIVIVGGADFAGFDPRPAKLVAVAASFLLTWSLRAKIVFRERRTVPRAE